MKTYLNIVRLLACGITGWMMAGAMQARGATDAPPALGTSTLSGSLSPPPLSVYGSLPKYELASLSPSGERVAIITTLDEQRMLLIMGKDGKFTLRIPLGQEKIRTAFWADDVHFLVRISNTANLGIGFTAFKAELGTYSVINVEQRSIFQVFAKQSNITGGVRRYYGTASRDGHLYGYFSGITLNTSTKGGEPYLETTQADLYEVDLDSASAHRIAENPRTETSRSWLMDSNGRIAAYMDFKPQRGEWRIVNADRDEVAKGVHPLGDVDLEGFGRRTDSVLLSKSNTDTGETEWFELPLRGGEAKQVFTGLSIEEVFYDRHTKELSGYVVANEQHFLNGYFNTITRSLNTTFAGLRVRVLGWNDAFDRLLVNTDGSGDTARWWLVDTNINKADLLGAAYPITAAQIAPNSVIKYTAVDGLDLDGILTLPPGKDAHNLPLVVMPHGGPPGADTTDFDWLAQAFAVRGYAVFQPNFRGSNHRGAAFEIAGHRQWGLKMQTDVSDGVAELAHRGIIDAQRVCIVGASYGGYVAMAGVSLQQGIYRCAVSYAGLSDLKAHRRDKIYESGGNQTVVRNYDESLGPEKILDAVSPVNFASQVTVPVLLIHGKNDTVVLFEQSSMMEKALRKNKKQVELLTLEGEDHWLSRSKTRMQMLDAAVSFVEKNNPL